MGKNRVTTRIKDSAEAKHWSSPSSMIWRKHHGSLTTEETAAGMLDNFGLAAGPVRGGWLCDFGEDDEGEEGGAGGVEKAENVQVAHERDYWHSRSSFASANTETEKSTTISGVSDVYHSDQDWMYPVSKQQGRKNDESHDEEDTSEYDSYLEEF